MVAENKKSSEVLRVATHPLSEWQEAVIAFLSDNLPRIDEGWDHKFSTSYQIGCEALSALGRATEVVWGAVPLKPAVQPILSLRWDDICVAVLWLARQKNKLSYLPPGGTIPASSGQLRIVNARPPPPPNILPAFGMGAARGDQETISVLATLGILSEMRHWTACAETVLWRCQPREWEMDVRSDARFVAAVQHAVHSIPASTRAEISKLVTVKDEDILHRIEQHQKAAEESRKRFGPHARLGSPMSPETARRSLCFSRCNDLDWIFFRNWRLSEGWNGPDRKAGTLQIFHDPLAIQMRKAVLSHLFPNLTEFSQ